MPTDGLLALSQWLSPTFPVSAYAYSHGLEAAMARGAVQDADSLQDWVETVLRAGAGRADAMLLCLALTGAEEIDRLADVAEALAGSAERLEETRAQGAAFAATLARITGRDVPARPYPVALGFAARDLGLPPETVAKLYLQAFAGNLVSAGVRFIPLGQAEGQRVLAGLHGAVEAAAAAAARGGVDDIGLAAFGADLAAMDHETQEVRLFRT